MRVLVNIYRTMDILDLCSESCIEIHSVSFVHCACDCTKPRGAVLSLTMYWAPGKHMGPHDEVRNYCHGGLVLRERYYIPHHTTSSATRSMTRQYQSEWFIGSLLSIGYYYILIDGEDGTISTSNFRSWSEDEFQIDNRLSSHSP
jgi:hypothetical protein